ncbi:Peptidase inhibitor I78 family protein [Brevundimonas sp. SH203]|uniref:hemolysin n=1 Tax=Brevundimonas sp. SH203 TaxID=345167 RepID=UPI0009C6452B|nr:hemolysin [Brevundimonas sp. SH203]GAW40004.1 Peptidase inhibitor I78 family protein [Brevundimonas sp. SH203]
MKIIASTLFAGGALALSACAPTQTTTPPTGGSDGGFKACKVSDYQSYVGRNRSTIPTAPAGQTFRVLCTTCPATMDYRENRVNFVYDQATDIVREVKCG